MSGDTSHGPPTWPAHIRPGALRWVRASSHYDSTIAFYRELIGLPVVGEFTGSFGEDGTIFGLPDAGTQMEVVRAHGLVEPNPFDEIVIYLDDPDGRGLVFAPWVYGRDPDPVDATG